MSSEIGLTNGLLIMQVVLFVCGATWRAAWPDVKLGVRLVYLFFPGFVLGTFCSKFLTKDWNEND